MKQDNFWLSSIEMKWILIIIFVYHILSGIYVYFTIFQKEIVIEEKNTYGSSANNQKISDTDGNVYVVENSLYMMQWESIELFNKLDVGKKFKVKGYGIRVPMLGIIPNIVSAEEIK